MELIQAYGTACKLIYLHASFYNCMQAYAHMLN